MALIIISDFPFLIPGPPMAIAVATPAMLPVPTRSDMANEKA